ncbi:MAG: hypothetical protein K2X66_18200 [Cyanobacteria bacterium]|nr:hypothetical protein [Cyanobacteriota bacterium]
MNVLQKLNFLPNENQFYDQLNALADENTQSIAQIQILLKGLSENQGTFDTLLATVSTKIGTHAAGAKDKFDHLSEGVCHTFVTPFDREDIQNFALSLYQLSKKLYEIFFALHSQYPVLSPSSEFLNQGLYLEKANGCFQSVLMEMAKGRKSHLLLAHTQELNALSLEASLNRSTLLDQLKESSLTPVQLILRKDLYDWVSDTLEGYHTTANLALQIVLKHS